MSVGGSVGSVTLERELRNWVTGLPVYIMDDDIQKICLFVDSHDDYYCHGMTELCDTDEERQAYTALQRTIAKHMGTCREKKAAFLASLRVNDDLEWFDERYDQYYRGYISSLQYPRAAVKFFGTRYVACGMWPVIPPPPPPYPLIQFSYTFLCKPPYSLPNYLPTYPSLHM